MEEELASAPAAHNALAAPGFIRGTGVIRDKDGNVKGTIDINVPCTPEQAQRLGLIPQPPQEQT